MACNIHCPECGEDLGKDKENSMLAYCGNCGEDNIYNEYGDDDDLTEAEMAIVRKKKRNSNRGRMISRY
jgi:uncharacterized Zn finger protein